MTPAEESRIHRVFVLSIALKGLDAALEILAALALAVVDARAISGAVLRWAHKELLENPEDLIAGYLRHAAENLSIDAKTFAVLYLASHGLIKLGLVVGLLRNQAWAYPVSLVAFGGFIAYQVYRYTFSHSAFLIVLTVFDLIVLGLLWHEWRKRQAAGARKA